MSATPSIPDTTLRVQCCIAGGGPAGMMLGFLLARAGVKVVVLEKHADFLRDFRGDTIHPSTLEVMYELGLLEEFLRRPHQEITHLDGQFGEHRVTIADFTHLPTHCKFLALMPQWDFLDFLAGHARHYPAFRVEMQAEVTCLVEVEARITGVEAKTPRGTLRVEADLTIGADGRGSIVRDKAGLKVIDLGAAMDVFWMRISKNPEDPSQTLGRVDPGSILVMLDRGDYWQCAFVIPKGTADDVRRKGLPAFRERIVHLAPHLRERVGELKDWDDIKLLTVKVDRLKQWHRPGLLCIGDAAHAMSPVGGVGINLAIQDAIAAANILAVPLGRGTVSTEDLQAVQERRELPTRIIQGVQIFIQNRGILNVLGSTDKKMDLPLPFRLLGAFPILRRIPARLVGMGPRPEHVMTPDTSGLDAHAR